MNVIIEFFIGTIHVSSMHCWIEMFEYLRGQLISDQFLNLQSDLSETLYLYVKTNFKRFLFLVLLQNILNTFWVMNIFFFNFWILFLCVIPGEVIDELFYFCVCFYTLLFTLEINARLADFGNFVPVFINSYFHSFLLFSCNFRNFVYNFEKKKKWNLTHLAIEDKVFPYTLNVEWWKSVGKHFRNRALNVTDCEKMKWEKNAPKGGSRTKKFADVPYIFYQLEMKPYSSGRYSINFKKIGSYVFELQPSPFLVKCPIRIWDWRGGRWANLYFQADFLKIWYVYVKWKK